VRNVTYVSGRPKGDIAALVHSTLGISVTLKSAAIIAGLVRGCAVVVLGFLLASAGLAFGQSIAPKNETRKDVGKCVGVVSAIGDTLAVSKFGFFGNEESKLPIDAWRIDDLVFSEISTALGTHSNLKRVSVPKGAFAVLEEYHNPFYNSTDDVRAILGRITATTKCDQYIVVMKTTIKFKNTQHLDGLGILSQGDQYSAWAEFTMNIYDGQNFSLLAKHPAVTGQKNFLGVDMKPYRKVDETWWPTAGATLSPAARDGFRGLVMESLEATVPKLLNN
jgi:hypothetical protein